MFSFFLNFDTELYWFFFFLLRFQQLTQQSELKVHETELLKTKLEQTSHHQQMEEVNNLLKNIGMLLTFTKSITKISNIRSIRLLKVFLFV